MATKMTEKVFHEIDLKDITGNSAQSRGMGALPTLQEMGYGLFEKLDGHEDKEPIWSMLLSEDPEVAKEAVSLIAANEGHIVDKGESLEQKGGQLQNIIVTEVGKGKYDVIGGMLRCVALAYNHAQDPKATTLVTARIMPKMSEQDLLFMSLDENNNRKSESPIDKAITFKRLRDEFKMKPDDIGKRQGLTGQSIRNHIKLLDPVMSDKKMDIHSGKLTIDAALKLYDKRKKPDTANDAESTNDPGKRARMHSVKKLIAAYGAKQKPEWMDQKEWEMFVKEDVRRYMAFKLKLKYKEFNGELVTKEEEEEAPKKDKAAPKKDKGAKPADATKPYGIIIPRSTAASLLTALGKDATDMSDEDMKAKLENIVSIADDTTTLESTVLQNTLNKLLSNYARGLNVTIKPPVK